MTKASYELWDMKSRNIVGGFDTEDEALAAIRGAIQRHGRCYIDDLFLGVELHGRSKPIAQGQALAERALAAAQPLPSST
jgi:hypothetical protein